MAPRNLRYVAKLDNHLDDNLVEWKPGDRVFYTGEGEGGGPGTIRRIELWANGVEHEVKCIVTWDDENNGERPREEYAATELQHLRRFQLWYSGGNGDDCIIASGSTWEEILRKATAHDPVGLRIIDAPAMAYDEITIRIQLTKGSRKVEGVQATSTLVGWTEVNIYDTEIIEPLVEWYAQAVELTNAAMDDINKTEN